jgi:hypothetical protein
MKWTLTAVGCGAVVAALFAVEYFFAVPETCACRATVPPILSHAFILDNSIGDSRYITILDYESGGQEFESLRARQQLS